MPERRTWQFAAVSAAAGLALAATAVAVAGPWDSGQRTAERVRAVAARSAGGADHAPETAGASDAAGPAAGPAPAPSASGVLDALDTPTGQATAPLPTGRGLAGTLDPLLAAKALGKKTGASVVDVATGKQLYGKQPGSALTPASTIKIATAAAALDTLGPDHRITTRTVYADGTVFLVGGGDPTLTAPALDALADATAAALKKAGNASGAVRVRYDTSLYSGPTTHSIGAGNENIAEVVPLMVNEGRTDTSVRGPAPRTADPAGDAARAFAKRLKAAGVDTSGPEPGTAAKKAVRLAATESAPLSALVERMVTNSDNDIAEALARQTAVALGEPASFDGAGKAVTEAVRGLGVALDGARFADGSGLGRDDRVSPALLTHLLVRAADARRPALRPILTGLPVAGFSGTLQSRYEPGTAGTGMVRAKTGTLTGVNSLAGTVVSGDGRLLAFAVLTNDTTDPSAAQSALDAVATALAGCGCR